jgi:hypothetical protein
MSKTAEPKDRKSMAAAKRRKERSEVVWKLMINAQWLPSVMHYSKG